MIVPMKKLTILVSARERLEALKKLRQLGVLHVQHVQSPSADAIYDLQNQLAEIERTAVILAGDVKEDKEGMEAAELVRKALDLDKRRQALRSELNEKRQAFKWFETWGKVSLASIEKLKEAGLYVRFYATDKNGFKTIPVEKQIALVRESKDGVRFAYFGEDEADKLDL
ncbi:hypothetical protein JXA02_13175, partial [candidate division KSB1 bacterium]|nr:hypothetical protein [candidate division KSB1 bacterium]